MISCSSETGRWECHGGKLLQALWTLRNMWGSGVPKYTEMLSLTFSALASFLNFFEFPLFTLMVLPVERHCLSFISLQLTFLKMEKLG